MRRGQRTTHSDFSPRETDLMKAVKIQDVDLVKALLESGADVEARHSQGQNVLYYTIPQTFTDDSMEILRLLVSKGINVNSSLDSDGCSLLVTAIVADLPEVVSFLLENNVDVDEPAVSKFSGCLSSDPVCQQNLVMDSSATSQIFFSKGCGHTVTPLCCAVMFRRHDLAQMLINANAKGECLSHGFFWRASGHSVCSNCEIQITPLHMAAYVGDLELTQMLLNHSTDSPLVAATPGRYLSYNDITPLWFSLLQGHESIVKLFLTVGKPIAPPCHFGTGLQVCLQEGHLAVAHMILRAGYNLEDDMDWIQAGKFPTKDQDVIDKILTLSEEPRPLLECCCSALREKFGVFLWDYLSAVGAPNKLFDILNFNDISHSSWRILNSQLTDANVISVQRPMSVE